MGKLFNRVRMTVSGAAGTGAITLGAAYSAAYCSFAEAGVASGDVVSYFIEDGSDFEIGIGTYTAAGTTMSRDTVHLSKIAGVVGATKINLDNGTQVYLSPSAAMLGSPAFHFSSTGGLAPNYDVRLISTGGNTTDGGGTLVCDGTLEIVPQAGSTRTALMTAQTASGSTGGTQHYNNLINVSADNADCGSSLSTSFSIGLYVQHVFGGSPTKGGREAMFANLILTSPTNPSNANRFYVACSGQGQANSSDGGGSGTEKGYMYGSNFLGVLATGATFFQEVSGGMDQLYIQAGASAKHATIRQFVYGDSHAVPGTTWDAALMVTADTGAASVGKNGLLFCNARGAHPLASTATIVATSGTSTVVNGIDFSSYGFTGYSLLVPGFKVDGSGNVTLLNIVGTTTNNDAAAACVGEYVSSSIASGSAVGLSTGAAANIASISLTAGDWDVWIDAHFSGGATTVVNYLEASMSTTTGAIDNTPGKIGSLIGFGSTPFNFTADAVTVPVGPFRVNLAGTTTVYFVGKAAFGTSTCAAFGIIQARRRR